MLTKKSFNGSVYILAITRKEILRADIMNTSHCLLNYSVFRSYTFVYFFLSLLKEPYGNFVITKLNSERTVLHSSLLSVFITILVERSSIELKSNALNYVGV